MIIEILLWATLPAILIALYIAKKDLFPEPKAAIVSSIGLGFLIFIPHTLFFQVIEEYYYAIYDTHYYDEVFINLLQSFFAAAFVEESFKFLIFLFLVSRFNAFNEPMDAIVYGVCISLGFSLMETLEWTHIMYRDYGEIAALDQAQARAWSSNTLHAGCGIVMGYILSKAYFQKEKNFLKLLLALFIPIIIHGSYNFSISAQAPIVTLIILIICGLLVLFGWRKSRDRQKLKKMETEDKVIKFNFIHIFSSLGINFILIVLLIYNL